jgi:hypothetical protein
MPGARRTRSLVCKNRKHTSVVTAGTPEAIRHSLHDGVTAYFALSPVTGLSCHRRRPRCESIIANLTPASGRQDHTTSPSEVLRARLPRKSRPSHPAPNVRDDRDTPLFAGAEWREVLKVICPSAQGENF